MIANVTRKTKDLALKRLSSAFVTSLLIVTAGAIGFQFGEPSASSLETRITELEQYNRSISNQVQGLTEFVVSETIEKEIDGDSQFLWVNIYIPQSEYTGDNIFDVCAGQSGWERSNFGVARLSTKSLPRPTYGIYMGIYPQTFEGAAYCVQQYFFPAIVDTTPLVFGEWDTLGSPLMPIGMYWELNSTQIDWESGSLSLNVGP